MIEKEGVKKKNTTSSILTHWHTTKPISASKTPTSIKQVCSAGVSFNISHLTFLFPWYQTSKGHACVF